MELFWKIPHERPYVKENEGENTGKNREIYKTFDKIKVDPKKNNGEALSVSIMCYKRGHDSSSYKYRPAELDNVVVIKPGEKITVVPKSGKPITGTLIEGYSSFAIRGDYIKIRGENGKELRIDLDSVAEIKPLKPEAGRTRAQADGFR